MKWTRGYDSPNLDDRRGRSPAMRGGGMGLGMLLPLIGRFGWKGGLLIFGLLFLAWKFLLNPAAAPSHTPQKAGLDDARSFVGFVADDAQKTWASAFEKSGKRYQPAQVVLFSDATNTSCGVGESAVGPFYCPRDQKVYLDLSFFRALHARLGAEGDFAQAYVIAHEMGHHVQHQLGVGMEHMSRAERAGESSKAVRTELQADCFAGVWAKSADKRDLLETGDLNEALTATAAIGDDKLQKEATGRVRPESWTHGSAEQRGRWFRRGYESGNPAQCDTFSAASL
jgi:uncharacterized protein